MALKGTVGQDWYQNLIGIVCVNFDSNIMPLQAKDKIF